MPFIRRGELSAGGSSGLNASKETWEVALAVGALVWGGVAFCSETFGRSWSDGSPKLLDRWELAQNLPTSTVKACP